MDKTSTQFSQKKHRVPNAFMLFVKDRKNDLAADQQEKIKIGAYMGKIWNSMHPEEKQMYYERHYALKKLKQDSCNGNIELDARPDSVGKGTLKGMIKATSEEPINDLMMSKKWKTQTALDVTAVSSSENDNKHYSVLPSVDDEVPLIMTPKSPKSRKRPPNAFLIFANEQRKSISLPEGCNRQGYASQVLADIWKNMDGSVKEKYFQISNELRVQHKMDNQGAASPDKLKIEKVKKVRFDIKSNVVKRKYTRKSKKPTPKKILRSSTTIAEKNTAGNAVPETRQEFQNANDVKPSTSLKSEESNAVVELPTTQAPPNHSFAPTSANTTFVQSVSSVCSLQSPCHCRHASAPALASAPAFQWPQDQSYNSYAPHAIFSAGMSNPYFRPGLSQSMLPLESAFWMYRQSVFQPPQQFPVSPFIPPPYYNQGGLPYTPYQSSFYNSPFLPSERFYGGHFNSEALNRPICSVATTTVQTDESNGPDPLLIVDGE